MKYIYILDLYFELIHPIVPKIIEIMKNNFIHVFHLRMVSSAAASGQRRKLYKTLVLLYSDRL